jgi:hypothetical protein
MARILTIDCHVCGAVTERGRKLCRDCRTRARKHSERHLIAITENAQRDSLAELREIAPDLTLARKPLRGTCDDCADVQRIYEVRARAEYWIAPEPEELLCTRHRARVHPDYDQYETAARGDRHVAQGCDHVQSFMFDPDGVTFWTTTPSHGDTPCIGHPRHQIAGLDGAHDETIASTVKAFQKRFTRIQWRANRTRTIVHVRCLCGTRYRMHVGNDRQRVAHRCEFVTHDGIDLALREAAMTERRKAQSRERAARRNTRQPGETRIAAERIAEILRRVGI